MRNCSDTIKLESAEISEFIASMAVSRGFARSSVSISSSSPNSGRVSSVKHHQTPLGNQQIHHRKERVQLRGVLEESPVANLAKTDRFLMM